MISWQITNKKQISKVNVFENLEQVDDLKIKITKCFITKKDINLFAGNVEDATYPIIPGYIAVGQITELVMFGAHQVALLPCPPSSHLSLRSACFDA